MNSVVITGAGGNLGLSVVSRIRPDINVIAFSRKPRNCTVGSNVDWHISNQTLFDDIARDVNENATVVHLASAKTRPECRAIIYETTQKVVEAAKQNGCRRIIFVSSDTVALPRRTEYTNYKRRAEMTIAKSGLPFLIYRPGQLFNTDTCKHIEKVARFVSHLGFVPLNARFAALRIRPVFYDELAQIIADAASSEPPVNSAVLNVIGPPITYLQLLEAIAESAQVCSIRTSKTIGRYIERLPLISGFIEDLRKREDNLEQNEVITTKVSVQTYMRGIICHALESL